MWYTSYIWCYVRHITWATVLLVKYRVLGPRNYSRFGDYSCVAGLNKNHLFLAPNCVYETDDILRLKSYNKSDCKHRNTLGCLDQNTCNLLRLWNSRDRETVYVYKYAQRMETMKQSGLWSSLGTHGSMVVIWWLCILVVVRPENLIFKSNLTLKVKVNCHSK